MSPDAPALGAWDSAYHAPVLVDEVAGMLGDAKTILDCTLGGGGHTAALLALGAHVTAIDRDPAAIEAARKRLATFEAAGRFRVILGNFAEADRLLPHESQKFDGILADLGISSYQIDNESRGFSFREGAPLDMRMETSGETAADLLNNAPEESLTHILREFADEPRARRLAREIVRRRDRESFATSDHLVNAIRAVLGPRSGPGDFARIFQAFRIAVNAELDSLQRALPTLRDMLSPNGVLAVISYHSGEDRIVKHAMREWSRACVCPPEQLQCACGGVARGSLVNRKAITASAEEVARNPRARSAHLRAWRKKA
ncbi:MAG TPA: 16S rRNA (cytosine(1402)-N(4))-methyltransferase RsmH [Gemmatimonadaceae bacterium]|jgi:16S rRNA (cytosine1402-N4)-methyltransferase|nr:16S rRNA (cytosine(1402)-N(4))-methyltransferase RsmH [Gemmatimonadaceae bacterium]